MRWPFLKQKQQPKTLPEQPLVEPLIIVVSIPPYFLNSKKEIIRQTLSDESLFRIRFESENTIEFFSKQSGDNFFDLWESGLKILHLQQGDVLIRIFLDQEMLRFSFQTSDQFMKLTPLFTSIFNQLCLPSSYFDGKHLPEEIALLIKSFILAICVDKNPSYQQELRNNIDLLSRHKVPSNLEAKFLPYVLNYIILSYIASYQKTFQKKDVDLLQKLLRFAFKNFDQPKDELLEALLYISLGQISQAALNDPSAQAQVLLKRSIESYQKAQKHFNQYMFPYDYGRLHIIIADLYNKLFLLTAENQSLRDCIFHLREAEKIFTRASMPLLWVKIKDKLASAFSLLASLSNNEEIAFMAIDNYNELQNFYQKTSPEKFAKTEEEIGHIHYYLGKKLKDESHLDESLKHYFQALEVLENLKKPEELSNLEKSILKAQEEIKRII